MSTENQRKSTNAALNDNYSEKLNRTEIGNNSGDLTLMVYTIYQVAIYPMIDGVV